MIVAEGAKAEKCAEYIRKLQWGRNMIVAEGDEYGYVTRSKRVSFNGAAT